jgi:hypothetical protein
MAFLKLRRRRNSIESWFSKLKRRARQFNICFPTYSTRVSERWIRAWVALS